MSANSDSDMRYINNIKTNEYEIEKQNALTYLINDMSKRFANPTDYYTILAVTQKSTPIEIKQAFENALKIYNIDVFTLLLGNENNVLLALKVFDKVLHDAYTIIGDASNKYYYDTKDIIKNISDPDKLITQFIDGFVDDFDPKDKSSYWTKDELNN